MAIAHCRFFGFLHRTYLQQAPVKPIKSLFRESAYRLSPPRRRDPDRIVNNA
jgi:hypothetical protein